jgi:cardiolipin synthase
MDAQRSTRRAPGRERDDAAAGTDDAALVSTLRGDHELRLLTGGIEYFPALVTAIEGARREVMLETYIFEFEHAPVSVAQALEQAARRGVAVRVVVDGVGTGEPPPTWRERWAAAGVKWRVFNPAGGWRVLLPTGWRRLHRKLAVIDGEVAFCGGINLLDDYHDPNHGVLVEPRFDFAVRATGPLVADVHETMTRLWLRLQVAREIDRRDFDRMVAAMRALGRAGERRARDPEDPSEARSATPSEAGLQADPQAQRRAGPGARRVHAVAALVLRDNVRYRRRIESTYRLAIAQARREIVIANAYFIPGVKLQRALIRAARRGVRVTLLLQGRYEYFMAFHASRAVYDQLLAAGIRIVEYEASFLHAKVAVMDGPAGSIATVGSSNLDPLSLLLAREANVFVRDDDFADVLRAQLQRAIVHQGRIISPEHHQARPWQARLLDWVAYGLMRIALLVTGKRY